MYRFAQQSIVIRDYRRSVWSWNCLVGAQRGADRDAGEIVAEVPECKPICPWGARDINAGAERTRRNSADDGLFGALPARFRRVQAQAHAGHRRRVDRRIAAVGWAQVHGLRGETGTIDKMEHHVRFDLDDLRQWSVALDLYIVLPTVRQVLRGV